MIIFFILLAIYVIISIYSLISAWYSHGYIIKNGRKAEGTIINIQSRSQTDQYGRVHISYLVSYQFVDSKEHLWRGDFTIKSSTCKFKEGDKILVYYLPDKPYKNTYSFTRLY